MNTPNDLPLITVCVTSYNHERFIRSCIDSLLNQTYPRTRIHVIDDCSTDGTVDILRSYGDRIDLTTRPRNLGVKAHGETINAVIRAAEGEFFYRIDSDDFIEPDYFARLMNEVASDPALDWICGGLNVVDEEGKVLDTWDYRDWPTDPNDALARGWQSCSVVMPHNGVFKTSFLRDNDLYFHHFDFGWGEDVLFTIRGMQCRPKVRLIPAAGFNWRTHGQNHSYDVENRVRLVLAVKEYYLENIPEETYLTHPALSQWPEQSCEYEAARDFLVAADLYAARVNFRVPDMFHNTETDDQIEKHLHLFDSAIGKYAERSRRLSSMFHREIDELYARLESERQLSEGRRSLSLGDFRRAASQFESVLKVEGESVRALNGLAEASFGLSQYDAAEQFSSSALAFSPGDTTALNNTGVLMHARGDFNEAEKAFGSAITTSHRNVDAHSNLLSLYATVSSGRLLDTDEKRRFLMSASFLSEQPCPPDKQLIKRLGDRLRTDAMNRYSGLYESESVRVLIHQPDNGALKYLMRSWADVLAFMGVQSELLSWGESTRERFEKFKPTAFVTVADTAYLDRLDLAYISRYRSESGLSIGHITTLRGKRDPVDFYITFHRDPSRDKRYSSLDRPLISLPFAIDPLKHGVKSLRPVWDYFFVGSNSWRKTGRTKSFIEPIALNHHGILAGTNWQFGIGELSQEQAAACYGLASVCPNYHLQEQIDSFNEVNERTFIIPACGSFEIVDNPAAMKELFAPDEMVVAHSAAEFLELFEHFLHNPAERESYILNGMRRVWKEYSLFTVLVKLCDFLGCQKGEYANPEKTERGTAPNVVGVLTP